MMASFVMGVLLARTLGVTGYGYYGLALSIVTIAGIPSELGISRVIIREIAASAARNDYPVMFGVLRWGSRVSLRISVSIGILIGVAGAVLLQCGSTVIGAALIAGAPIVPLETAARLKGGALQGLHHVVLGQVPANLLRPLLMSVLILVLLGAGLNLYPPTAVVLYSLATAVILAVAHVWLRNRLPAAVPPTIIQEGHRWLASSIPLALTDGMRVIQSELSILLIGVISAPAEVGLFRIASTTAMAAAAPFVIIARVAMPVIARLHAEGDHAKLQKAVTACAWAQLGGVLLLSAPIFIAPELLLRIAFGPEYVGAAAVLQIIALGQVTSAFFGPNGAVLNMMNRERRMTRAMAIALVLNLILVPPFAYSWGNVGAATAFVLSLLCWNILAWHDAKRLLDINTSAILKITFFAR
jgi:O-antigen/teichoic acid export membrane protein